MTVVTSKEAWELAKSMCEEYKSKREAEKKVNLVKEPAKDLSKAKKDPSRQVTEIDYQKHEQTVKEIERKEAEDEWARKAKENAEWCTLDHEHGPHCQRPRHGCSHDHQKEWQIYEKETQEKIKAADRFRMEGNDAYNKQNFGLAAVHYRKALLQFDYTFPEGKDEEQALNEVKLKTLLNLAACKVQQEDWPEVLTNCRLALEVDPRSVKAYYRMGQAHLATDNFQLAKDVLMSAYDVEPKNPDVLRALKTLKEKQISYKTKTKFVFKEMSNAEGNERKEEPKNDASSKAAAEKERRETEERRKKELVENEDDESEEDEEEEEEDVNKRPSLLPNAHEEAKPAKEKPTVKEEPVSTEPIPTNSVTQEPKGEDSSDDDALIGMPKPKAAVTAPQTKIAEALPAPSKASNVGSAAAGQPESAASSEGLRQRRPASMASSSKAESEQAEPEQAAAAKPEDDVDDDGAEKLMQTVGKIVAVLGVVSVMLGLVLAYQLSRS